MRTQYLRPKAGFTLVELLTVIVIIGVLAGLSVVVISKARESSRNTTCINRLRQIGVALQLFASDHRGQIPWRSYEPENNPLEGKSQWHRWILELGYLDSTDGPLRSNVFYCPSWKPVDPNDTTDGINPIHAHYRYGLRLWAPPGQTFNAGRLLPLNAIQNPARFFLVADSYYTTTGTQGYQIAPGQEEWRVHLRHSHNANTLFADGHVAAMPREYFATLHQTQPEYSGRADGTSGPFHIWPAQ